MVTRLVYKETTEYGNPVSEAYWETWWTEEQAKTNSEVCFFVLRLNVPVNNFSVMSGRIRSMNQKIKLFAYNQKKNTTKTATKQLLQVATKMHVAT